MTDPGEKSLTSKYWKGIKGVKEDLFSYEQGQKQERSDIQRDRGAVDTDKPRRYFREIYSFPAPKATPENQEELVDYIASVFSPIRKNRSEEFFAAIVDKDGNV